MNLGAAGGKAQWRERMACGLCLAMAAAAYARLFWGVDFTDEAFYGAMPHGFANGYAPYAEELSLAQNAGLLLTPAYWLFERATSGVAGLVLFNRHLFFALLAGCAWLGGRAGRAWAGRETGWMTAAFVFVFSYFNIPSLSYNTLGAFGLFAGIFLLLRRAAPGAERASAWSVAAANLGFVVAAFAYPTLVVACAAGVGVSAWCVSREARAGDKAGVRAWLGSAVAGALLCAGFLGCAGPDRLRAVLDYTTSLGYAAEGSFDRKLELVGRQAGLLAWFCAVVGIWSAPVLAPAHWWKKRPGALVVVVALIGAWAALVLARHSTLRVFPAASTPVILALGLWFPAALSRIRDRRLRLNLAMIAGLPSVLAAAAVTWSSTNGLYSATLGIFPAAAAAWLALMVIAREEDGPSDTARLRVNAVLALAVPMLFFLGGALLAKSYRDEARAWGGEPTTMIGGGPYAGIRTTAAKARMVEALAEDFAIPAREGRTLLVLGDLPGGYLFSMLRPRTISTWLFWSGRRELDMARLAGILDGLDGGPDWILQARGAGDWTDSELERRGYETHLRRDEFGYRILRRSNGTAGAGAMRDGMRGRPE